LTTDVHEAFARLRMPVLVVLGREGVLAPSEASEVFRRVNSRIDVRILDRCSQNPQDEQAIHFNNLVREFAGAPVTQYNRGQRRGRPGGLPRLWPLFITLNYPAVLVQLQCAGSDLCPRRSERLSRRAYIFPRDNLAHSQRRPGPAPRSSSPPCRYR